MIKLSDNLKCGDKIEVLKSLLQYANVKKGDVLEVRSFVGGSIKTKEGWRFSIPYCINDLKKVRKNRRKDG